MLKCPDNCVYRGQTHIHPKEGVVTIPSQIDVVTCEICKMTGSKDDVQQKHENSVHKFVDSKLARLPPSELKKEKKEPKDLEGSTLPYDPVLRYLLLQKGRITHEELEEAETQLRTIAGL